MAFHVSLWKSEELTGHVSLIEAFLESYNSSLVVSTVVVFLCVSD